MTLIYCCNSCGVGASCTKTIEIPKGVEQEGIEHLINEHGMLDRCEVSGDTVARFRKQVSK